MGRPIRLSTGTWSTTAAANTELYSADLPKIAFQDTLFSQKVQGFLGFRGKAVVRVQINAQRFQQGRLLLHYVPFGSVNVNRTNVIRQSLTLRTQTPCVDLDVATATSAVLEMPYVSTTTHFNVQDYTGPIGTFYLAVFSPLNSAAASSVSYTIWVHFEDVELSFPGPQFTPQAFQAEDDIFRPQAGMFDLARGATKSFTKSFGISTPSEEELKKAGKGPLQSATSVVSSGAQSLSSVPLLSSFVAPITWVSDVIGGVASIFGWSRPRDQSPPQLVAVNPYSGSTNVDAIDNSKALGYSSKNAICELPGFGGKNVDELSFAYVMQRPAYIGLDTWSTSQAEDATVFSLQVGPSTAFTTRTVATASSTLPVYDFAPFGYVANVFKYWRGSITYTFKFVKTEFHSGRLLICFSPTSTSVPSDANIDYLYREVVDIRYSNEYTVTIPYVATTPYLPFATNSGLIFAIVQNPLVAPTTVAQSLQILVSVSAGPDFEVAVPVVNPTYQPIVQLPTTGEEPATEPAIVPKFEPQALGVNEVEVMHAGTDKAIVDPVSTTDINSGGLSSAKYCIGERILSLRQLLKRFSIFYADVNINVFGTIKNWNIRVRDIALPTFIAGSNITVYQANSGANYVIDSISWFAPLYMFQRGSVRIKTYNCDPFTTSTPSYNQEANTNYRCRFQDDVDPHTTIVGGDGSADFGWRNSPAIFSSIMNGGVEAEIANYAPTYSTVNFLQNGTVTPPTNYQYLDTMGVEVISSEPSQQINFLRAIGEDFNYGFFIGVMPMVTIQAFNYTINW